MKGIIRAIGSWDDKVVVVVGYGLLTIISLCLTVIVIICSGITMSQAGLIGDFIGGLFGTIASVIGVAATIVIAFRVNALNEKLAHQEKEISNSRLKHDQTQHRLDSYTPFISRVERALTNLNQEELSTFGGSTKIKVYIEDINDSIRNLLASEPTLNFASFRLERLKTALRGIQHQNDKGEFNNVLKYIEYAKTEFDHYKAQLIDWVQTGEFVEPE